MKVFLSYSRSDTVIAEEIYYALKEINDLDIFFDQDQSKLPLGYSYHDLIREEISESWLFIFLVSTESVNTDAGKYTLTELGIAQNKWEHPEGHVLPVIVDNIDFSSIPAYLRSVSILQTSGDIAAEVAKVVFEWDRPPSKFRLLISHPPFQIFLVIFFISIIGVGAFNIGTQSALGSYAEAVFQSEEGGEERALVKPWILKLEYVERRNSVVKMLDSIVLNKQMEQASSATVNQSRKYIEEINIVLELCSTSPGCLDEFNHLCHNSRKSKRCVNELDHLSASLIEILKNKLIRFKEQESSRYALSLIKALDFPVIYSGNPALKSDAIYGKAVVLELLSDSLTGTEKESDEYLNDALEVIKNSQQFQLCETDRYKEIGANSCARYRSYLARLYVKKSIKLNDFPALSKGKAEIDKAEGYRGVCEHVKLKLLRNKAWLLHRSRNYVAAEAVLSDNLRRLDVLRLNVETSNISNDCNKDMNKLFGKRKINQLKVVDNTIFAQSCLMLVVSSHLSGIYSEKISNEKKIEKHKQNCNQLDDLDWRQLQNFPEEVTWKKKAGL